MKNTFRFLSTCTLAAVTALILPLGAPARAAEAGAGPKITRTLETSESWYYRITLAGKPFGRGMMTLMPLTLASGTAVETDIPGQPKTVDKISSTENLYAMHAVLDATLPGGQQVHGEVDGTLTREFAPRKVTMKRTMKGPDGAELMSAELVADVGTGGIALTMKAAGQENTRTVPKPDVPLVFMVETYVEFCAPDSLDGATIHEFKPETGEAVSLHAKVKPADSGREVELTAADGVVAYLLKLSPEGKLTGWSEGPTAPAAERITKEEYEKLSAPAGAPNE